MLYNAVYRVTVLHHISVEFCRGNTDVLEKKVSHRQQGSLAVSFSRLRRFEPSDFSTRLSSEGSPTLTTD